ncbi:MAG: WD40 repeat domain-containing protein [Anaerolineae bacterium]|nr:WD40 repeat domain-containing protein [Anaerolineae bacterium]
MAKRMIIGILFLLLASSLTACAEAPGKAPTAAPAVAAATLTPDTSHQDSMATLNAHRTLEAAYTSTPLPTPTPTPIELPVGLGTALPPLQAINAGNAAQLEVVGRYYETWQLKALLSPGGTRLVVHSFFGLQAFEFPSLSPLPLISTGITTMPGGAPANERNLLGISPDGSLLAVADRANLPYMVQLWSLDSGEKRCDLNLGEALSHYHQGALRMEFTPDNAHFSLIGRWAENGKIEVRLWAVNGCRQVVNEPLENAEVLPVFAPDGSRYAQWLGGKVLLTAVDGSGEVVVEPVGQVFGLGWMPDSSQVIAVYGDRTIVYDAASGEALQEFSVANGYKPALVRVSPDGRWITLLGEKTWYVNTETGTAARQLAPEEQAEFPLTGVGITPQEDEWLAAQGEQVQGGFRTSQGLTATWDTFGRLALVEEATGAVLAEAAMPFVTSRINQQADAFAAWESSLDYDLDALIHRSAARRSQSLVSNTGQYAAITNPVKNKLMVELYRTDNGSLNASPEFLIASSGPVPDYYEFRFSADDRLVAGASDNSLVLWESATGVELGRMTGAFLEDTLFDFDFSPDASLLLVSSIKPGGGAYWLTLVDTASMTILRQHEIIDCRMSAPFAVTSDSQYVVTLTPGCRVGVYDVATWSLSMDNNPFFTTYAGPSEINFGLSADDSLLAIGYQKTLEVWDMETGSPLFAVNDLTNDIFAFIGSFNLVFSPDNTLLLVRYGQWIHAWSTLEIYGIPQ